MKVTEKLHKFKKKLRVDKKLFYAQDTIPYVKGL